MKELDHQDLVKSLEDVIDCYKENMDPFAQGLVNQMVDAYYQYKQNADNNQNKGGAAPKLPSELNDTDVPDYCLTADVDEDEGESNMAALGCLDVVQKILNCNLRPEVYQNISGRVFQVLDTGLLEGKEDVLERAISLLSRVLYMSPCVSDELLAYYPILCYIWTGRPNLQFQLNIQTLPKNVQQLLTGNVSMFGEGMDSFSLVGCF